MYYRDLLSVIKDKCFRHKAILILGARQVGKTTLLKQFMQEQTDEVLYLNCDEAITVSLLTNRNIQLLQTLIGTAKIVVIDEAQKVDNIGLTLKMIVDNIPDVQVIATGSSAFELRNRLNEPLTGRKYEYRLFPISTNEIHKTAGYLDVQRQLESRLIYGSYPDILVNGAEAHELLNALTDSYLYKDILASDNLRKPELLDKLLKALAFQVGSEVSYHELSQTIGSDAKTVERYIELLEKSFIIFRLNGLSRNLRNELKKAKKIYFYDNGVRNAVIQQFAPLDMRNDVGALWENFFISERIKFNHYRQHYCNIYFWRTKTQQEIDYIEESNGSFDVFEMKWNPKNAKTAIPANFLKAYPVANTAIVTPDNYLNYLL
ncbi:MAG: ATP-binding protein [Muribaculaceae bacterium]|nr:ATP-binding protein [Muribaculaceae bacterium]